MNWLFPGFLAGAALIGLPILLHFLRSKPKTTVPFPSLRFLGVTAIQDTNRHRLQRWITLILRCLAITALAATFARPFWQNAAAAHRHAFVVAIDNSMSMQTRNRWDVWRSHALHELESLHAGDQAALLVMFPRPAWLVPMTDDLERVRTALQKATPGFEKTRYGPALQVAADALDTTPAAKRTLLWMADEQRAGWLGVDLARKLPSGITLILGDAAPPALRQATITRLQRASDTRLVATVRLFAPEKDQRDVVASEGTRVLIRQKASLVSGDNTISLNVPADAKAVRVSLLPTDDLAADDAAWIVLEKPIGDHVLLDSVEGPDFLAHAVQATKKLEGTGLDATSLPKGAWPAEMPVIVRSSDTFQQPQRCAELDHFLDAGGPAWIFVDGSSAQTAWLARHGITAAPRERRDDEPWTLRDWDTEHPILAAYAGQSLLPLLNVGFQQGFDLDGSVLVPIANWPNGKTALAEWSSEGHRVLVAGFPMTREATNWPAQPSFVPFVHQAVRWLGAFSAARHDWRVGDVIPLPPGSGTWHALDVPLPTPDRAVVGSVRAGAPGVYEFSVGGTTKLFAVNTPPEESDLAAWPDPSQLLALASPAVEVRQATQTHLTPPSHETSEDQQRLWWWVLAFCGLFILAELALANRTAM